MKADQGKIRIKEIIYWINFQFYTGCLNKFGFVTSRTTHFIEFNITQFID
jgi:hypothetical protein